MSECQKRHDSKSPPVRSLTDRAGGLSLCPPEADFFCVLQPTLFPKMPEQQHDDEDAGPDRGRVAVAPRQLRDVGEVHAIPAGEQGQGEEDYRDHGEDS